MTGLEPLVVQIDQGSSVLRLVVSGELDIATVPDLEAAFEQALGTDPQSIEVGSVAGHLHRLDRHPAPAVDQ